MDRLNTFFMDKLDKYLSKNSGKTKGVLSLLFFHRFREKQKDH